MPPNTNIDPARTKAIADKVAELRASNPAIPAMADTFGRLGQGQFGEYLASLLKQGVPRKLIVDAYVAGRAVEFSTRPKYRPYDAGHALSNVRRHAANHVQQAASSLFLASLKGSEAKAGA